MCGRFVQARRSEDLADDFFATLDDSAAGWEPSWNIAPTTGIPVVVESAAGEADIVRRVALARWSLTPAWSKTLATKFTTFNARIESAAEKPTFRTAVKSKRAIIPASGYYEWVGEGKARRPHYISLPDSELALAGLYSWWADPAADPADDARWHLTVTMLTNDAVQTIEDVHDREPVPLPRDLWDEWLDPAIVGDQTLLERVAAASLPIAHEFVHHEVAPLRGNGPELIRAAA